MQETDQVVSISPVIARQLYSTFTNKRSAVARLILSKRAVRARDFGVVIWCQFYYLSVNCSASLAGA